MNAMLSALSPRLVAVVLAGWGGAGALAQPMQPSEFAVECRSSFGHNEGSIGPVPRTLDVDWVGVWGGEHEYNMQAQAETFGGLRPQATASAEARGSGSTSFYCTACARIEYYARLRAVNPPPPGQYSVPIRIGVRGHASGLATSQVVVGGHTYGVHGQSIPSEYDTSVPWELTYGDPEGNLVGVRLTAFAQGSEWPPNPTLYPRSSLAVADPLFELDQAQFDLTMGGATFPLADYFDFEYSEGIIPEPPTCDPDFTCDGNADQDDVACLIDAVAGNPGCECQDADFNQDGNLDQGDVEALITAIAGGGCP